MPTPRIFEIFDIFDIFDIFASAHPHSASPVPPRKVVGQFEHAPAIGGGAVAWSDHGQALRTPR